METFTIDQLRADVVRNFEDQIDSKTTIRLQTTRHSSGDIQYDVLIDFMIAALIGDDHLDIMKTIYKLEKIDAIIEENIRARGCETHYERKHHKEWYKGQIEAYKSILNKIK